MPFVRNGIHAKTACILYGCVLYYIKTERKILMAKYEADMLNAGYCEFLAPVRLSGKRLAARISIVLGAAASVLLMLSFTLTTIPAVSFMLFVFILFFSWFLWQFTSVEYEYTIACGEFELCKIYGARVRKTVLEIKTSDISVIVPASQTDILARDAQSLYFACNKDDPNALCLVYTANGREKNLLVIAAPDKTRSCLKYYRRSAFTQEICGTPRAGENRASDAASRH